MELIRPCGTSNAVCWEAEPGPYYLGPVYGNAAFYLRLQLLWLRLECAVLCGEVIGHSAVGFGVYGTVCEGMGIHVCPDSNLATLRHETPQVSGVLSYPERLQSSSSPQ
jgi:hypothetical protein